MLEHVLDLVPVVSEDIVFRDPKILPVPLLHHVVVLLLQGVEEDSVGIDVLQEVRTSGFLVLAELELAVLVVEIQLSVEVVIGFQWFLHEMSNNV